MSTDLVPTSVTPSVLLPVSVDEAKEAMRAYQQVTAAILDRTDWQGTPGQPGSFIKKSGWRRIAKAYGLSLELVAQDVDRDPETGAPLRAQTVMRASHPNGQHMDGVGYCSSDESRFRTASGRQKLENDLRATAATRAANRAISDLVGVGQVSAEEVGDDAPAAVTALPMADGKDVQRTGEALMALYGSDEEPAQVALEAIVKDLNGELPLMVARALQRAAQHRPRPEAPVEAEAVDAEPLEEAA